MSTSKHGCLALILLLLGPRYGWTQSTCSKAGPEAISQSSAGVNVYANPQIRTGTQLYLADYSPSSWTGRLTARTIGFDPSQNKLAVLAATPNWDASCVLSGVTAATGPCSSGVTTLPVEAPMNRVMLTWNGTQGIPFEWESLSPGERSDMDSGDAAQTSNRLDYLRGVTTNEINSRGTCPQLTSRNLPCFRARTGILADIVDSSPLWVGPAQTYDPAVSFKDELWGAADTPQETSYDAFRAAQESRLNVVYVGANDGFVHGFRSGRLDSTGNLINDSTTPNDGYEVLAYMPGAVLRSIHNAGAGLDLSNPRYGHSWFVDATPASGDVFYDNAWHTWLVGGLGAGGAAIYALDITNPGKFNASGAHGTVIGEWSASNMACVNVADCQKNLGNTYGTALIRRFHNGSWGVIFGNGYGSTNNTTAGIYIMLIDPTSGSPAIYYLATPATSGTGPNGIANPASADIDLDHITDYIYAGDLHGNVWRFDVTSTDPAKWAVSGATPLFTTPNEAPITAGITVSVLRQFILQDGAGLAIDTGKPARVIVNFGTGRQIPQSGAAAAQYASGSQYLFGIWDWNFNTPTTGWNALSNVKLVGLDAGNGPATIAMSSLQEHKATTVTQTAPALTFRTISREPVCWVVPDALDAGDGCATPGTQYGWYIQLPGTLEQILFNPVISPDGELVVNTFIPAQAAPSSCPTTNSSTGFSMAVMPGTGSADPGGTGTTVQSYFTVSAGGGNTPADAVQLNGVGIPWFLSSGQKADHNAEYLITQTSKGAAPPTAVNRHTVIGGKRLKWVQRR